eukprot:456677_1
MQGQRSFKRSHLPTNSGDESDYSYQHTNDMTQLTQMTQTNPCVQEFPFETRLVGKYIKLKQIDNGENVLMYQIQSITSPHIIKTGDCDDNDIPDLIEESTNQFLLLNDYTQCQEHTKTQTTNFCIAITVILIQIMSYIFLAYYLWYSKSIDMEHREANCYGPNCHWKETKCMDIITGLVMALLLIGFLCADFISTCSLIKDCITKNGFKLKGQLIGSIFILIELFSAIICGILVGLISESKFDAINGAVGILFVHDLDEKIHQAMCIIEANWKRLVALVLWIVISVVIAMSMACIYQTEFWFGDINFCTVDEFMCSDGDCIWRGFLCNGVENCAGGDDEFVIQSLNMECDYSLIECPDNMFVCEVNGECIDNYKRCNGIIDCLQGTDEGRHSNCSHVIANIECGEEFFKCNNGQCIDRKFHCDTVVDCVDGSDEYPNFYSLNKWPYLKECPYDQLIKCSHDEVLCKKDGHCISKTRICDKVNDCVDFEDERFCFYHWDDFTEFKCGQKIANISKIDENNGRIILFEKETIYEYNNLSHFWWIYENIIYPNNSWILEIGTVIPLHWRCDGIMDCKDGSDEQLCKYFPCNDDEYLCNSTGHCIVEWWQCDGVPDCDFSHTWLLGSDDETGDKCSKRQDYYDNRKIECNQMFTQQISQFSDTTFYEGRATMDSIDLFFITVPCNKYETMIITTCTNHTKTFNTFLRFRKGVDHSISAMSRYIYTNDDAGDNCAFNYFASTITLDQSVLELICDDEYVIEVTAKYLKQSFGDYGLEVICS